MDLLLLNSTRRKYNPKQKIASIMRLFFFIFYQYFLDVGAKKYYKFGEAGIANDPSYSEPLFKATHSFTNKLNPDICLPTAASL